MKRVSEHVVLGYTRNETQKEEKRKRFWVNASSFGLTLNGKEKKRGKKCLFLPNACFFLWKRLPRNEWLYWREQVRVQPKEERNIVNVIL